MLFSAPNALPEDIPDHLTIPQFLLDYPHRLRRSRKDFPCFIEQVTGRSTTLTEIRERTFALANGISHKFSFGENDVALICSPNHLDYPVALWAVHRLDAIFTGASPTSTRDELVYQLKQSNASLIFVHPLSLDVVLAAADVIRFPYDRVITFDSQAPTGFLSISDLVAQGLAEHEIPFVERTLLPGEAKNKVAVLCFSSGTTGPPKAVAISHYAIITNLIQMAAHNGVDGVFATKPVGYNPGDVMLLILPLNHVAGLICNMHFPLFSGMTLVVMEKYSLEQMLISIARFRVTHLLLVPPQVVALSKDPSARKFDLSSVRHVLSGAAPLSPEMSSQLFDLFPDAQIGQIYGLTETATTLSMLPARQARGPLGSVGQLLPGVSAKVIKNDGSLASYGEPGELYVCTPSQALGYYHDDVTTKDTFVDGRVYTFDNIHSVMPLTNMVRWVRTGDQVLISSEGELYILDRIKELIKVRAFQVAPAELEGCLLEHPDIQDCAVVGMPDSYSGEVPAAYVVLAPRPAKRLKDDPSCEGKIRSSIFAHVAARKSRYKRVRYVEFVDAIPKTASGKILRRMLRERMRPSFQATIEVKL